MKNTAFSVSEIHAYIKNLFQDDYILRNVQVKGEISNYKDHPSGHIYFTLKDENGILSSVIFRSKRGGIQVPLAKGMHVVAKGNISIYEKEGKYQLYVDTIVPDGIGELYLQFEQTRNKLEEMGMFAAEYKRPIPPFALRIGIVTAQTGAAIRDIMNISHRRNPYVQLYLYPAIVQGVYASASICKGIEVLDEMKLDCIIVGRGGGSLEDLWAFNEESVAYAIFNTQTPVISAVGHEIDFTIADYVADLRAPTPSAAAELAVFEYRAFVNTLDEFKKRLSYAQKAVLQKYRQRLQAYQLQLALHNPEYVLNQQKQRWKEDWQRLQMQIQTDIQNVHHRLKIDAARLEGLSPLKRLQDGYASVTLNTGELLTSISQVSEGQVVQIQVKDGKIKASVIEQIAAPVVGN